MARTVKIIGICGYPQHGKTSVQRFLERLGVRAIDDSEPLRRLAMQEFGLTWEQVSTQTGKASICHAFGTTMTVRQAIGDLGKVSEAEHGPNYWIERAINAIEGSSPVSFGSVRMGQPHAIRAAGGFVVAIHDPRRPQSHHDFDQYEASGCDRIVLNDGDLWQFEHRVVRAVAGYLDIDADQHLLVRQRELMAASYVHAG